MARVITLTGEKVAKAVQMAGPSGVSPEALETTFADASRSTINRRLSDLCAEGRIKPLGQGRAIRYVPATPFLIEDIERYFEVDWQERPSATFREELLLPDPGINPDKVSRLASLQARSRVLDKKFLSDFLIDFSWASSVLEGSSYSSIDTQALIEYGQRNQDKPIEDAFLILNHKNAIQYLWSHREITVESLCKLQGFLTDRHGMAEVAESDHFLPDEQRGAPREYEENRLGLSAYNPPFRPGTGYIANALIRIVGTAKLLDPVTSAFYLMTRIPYLQAFVNGNKRTARLAANMPLLSAGMLPISFVDFMKNDYVAGMRAFYELGDIQIIERSFINGYARSIVRGSDIPVNVKASGFKVSDVTQELATYVQSGRMPDSSAARIFITTVKPFKPSPV